jgi:hypothetical protein
MKVPERTPVLGVRPLREADGQNGDAPGVARGGGIAALDRGYGGAHEGVEEVPDVRDQQGVLEGDGRLAGEGGDELLVHRGERDDGLVHQGHGAQHRLGVPLLVDELHDPDDLLLVVAHGHDQHGLGPIAGLLVEGAADLIGGARGQVVGVGHVERMPRQRHIARDRELVQGHRELFERHDHGVVLGQLEAQLVVGAAGLLLAPLDEVQAAGIRRRDLPALGEDQLQQLVDVPLRREGDPDPVQVVQLLALAGEGPVELVDDAAVVDGVEGSLEAQAQALWAHGPEQQVVEEGIAAQRLVGLARIADAHEEGAQVAARLEPRLDRRLLGLELGRTDEDQAAALAVEVVLELGKRTHLAARDPGRQRPGDQIAALSPDDDVRHERRRPEGITGPFARDGRQGPRVRRRPGPGPRRPGRPDRART